ncbi:hypothetical protein DH2020_029943 [Rehmannia glutinosa]|uniref:Gnk2-homologous domain-containing protein n=1 Tax=Rehmannia glutinosa TaxID=99300 RepID=A0ABR0VM60_REHGL
MMIKHNEFIKTSSYSPNFTPMFVETIVADDKTAISGTFQCRNDLSPNECENCARKFPTLSKDSCGENVPALSGCNVRYQEENGAEIDSRPDKLLHRACSKHKIKKNGFVEMKYAALAALESGVISGNGFCDTMYESIRIVAQCVEFLGACDCGECVNSAVEIAGEDECRFSVSGEVYLDSCFVSYDYDRNRGFGGYFDEDNGDRSPKLVAIVVGGLALLSLGLAFCYFLRSCGTKKEVNGIFTAPHD